MKPTQQLHELGQSLWLDNITRALLTSGTLQALHRRAVGHRADLEPDDLRPRHQQEQRLRRRHPREARRGQVGRGRCSSSSRWKTSPRRPTCSGRSTTRPTASTAGCRWKSRRCSPTTRRARIAAAKELHARAGRPNLFIKIPGTPEGLPAIEEAIFAGVPINVTLLFSREQYLAAAEAYLRGIERRIEAGLNPESARSPRCSSAAGTRPWSSKVPVELRNRLGIAIAKQTYKAYRDLLDSPRCERLANAGARPQRLLWASTGTKDPDASDVLYVEGAAGAVHGQHDARGDAARVRRPRRDRRPAAGRRRRCRGGARPFRAGRHRRRRAGRPAPARGRRARS